MRKLFIAIICFFVTLQICATESIAQEIIEITKVCIPDETVSIPSDCHPEVARLLGWQSATESSLMCGGYYVEPYLPFGQAELQDEEDLRVSADETSLYEQGSSILRGGVIVEQPGKQISADTAYLYRDAATGKVTKIELVNRVSIRESGRLIVGQRGEYFPTEQKGSIVNAFYRAALTNEKVKKGEVTEWRGLTAWGRAAKIERESSGNYEFDKVTYTTCPPMNHDWQLQAEHVYLDRDKGRGYAKKAMIKVKDTPILYLPYFSFPIDDRRESGFLMPTIGYRTRNGMELTIPYYWNIAPNYDATFKASAFTTRGVMADGEFRYLTQSSVGAMQGTFLPNDRRFAEFIATNPEIKTEKNDRSSFFFAHNTVFNNYWQANARYQQVSDDYYFQDFRSNVITASRNQLLRQLGVTYTDPHWFFTTKLQGYQTLHPINQPVFKDIYSRLPQIMLNASYPQVIRGVDIQWKSEFDYFVWPGPLLLGPKQPDGFRGSLNPDGYRTHLNPIVSVPFRRTAGFLVPNVQLMQTNYGLTGNFQRHLSKDSSRTVPLMNIDSGLFFDRETLLWGTNYRQTLEPRLFYLYVPFVDQRHIKVFEGGYYVFNYNQLFRTNRFSGLDRIGDTNQVSLGLTSRLLDSNTGKEKITFGIGQIYYFANRRVQLCDISLNCQDAREEQVGFVSPTASVSPIAAQLRYALTREFTLSNDTVWDPKTREVNNVKFDLQYQPKADRVINLGYSFLVNGDLERAGNINKHINLSQVYVSTGWPLFKNWHLLGALRYNINNQSAMSYYFGAEYESCCWAIRLMGGRTVTAIGRNNVPGQNNSGVFLQFLFKGLGTAGYNDTSSMVRNQIRGYRDIFM